jgi:hypothetical protein
VALFPEVVSVLPGASGVGYLVSGCVSCCIGR